MAVEGFDLRGKRALVVGASSDVGRAIGAALQEAGARVAGADLTPPPPSSSDLTPQPPFPAREGGLTAASIAGEGGGGVGPILDADLTAPGGAERLVALASGRLGGLDIVVSCGDLRMAGSFTDLSDEEWERLLAVNLTAPVRLLRAAGRELLAGGGGKIVVVVSMLGERGVPNTAAYGACQAALIQLVRALSLEWARQNVRINGIGLGWLEGDPLVSEETAGQLIKYLPSRRLGRPDEVGAVAVYLASDRADMMTGQTLFVDGAIMSHA